jgi:zinc protease
MRPSGFLRVVIFGSAISCFAAETDLNKPPQTPPVPDIKMPAMQRFKLPGGLTVVASADDRFPLTTIQLVFLAGSKYDPKDMPGLSDSVASLLNQGTKTRTAKQIALEAGDLGGQINGVSKPDTLVLNGTCLSQNLDKFLAVFADVTKNSSFPADEVELRKQNRLQELRADRSNADYVAREALASAMFISSPYSHVGPSEHALSLLDQKALVHFRDSLDTGQCVLDHGRPYSRRRPAAEIDYRAFCRLAPKAGSAGACWRSPFEF